MVKIGTAFQNRFEFLIGIETMNNGKEHQASLDNTKGEEQGNSIRHGERGKKRHNKNHRMEKMEVLLKAFVLEGPSEGRS